MIRDIRPGSGSCFFTPTQILDPGTKKILDPGFGSATLELCKIPLKSGAGEHQGPREGYRYFSHCFFYLCFSSVYGRRTEDIPWTPFIERKDILVWRQARNFLITYGTVGIGRYRNNR
jgi:hypothetical protein